MSEILETLFGSRARTRVLRFFLLNPEKECRVTEIAKKNMLTPAVVRKEINEIKKIKFIAEHSKKGIKYYQNGKETKIKKEKLYQHFR